MTLLGPLYDTDVNKGAELVIIIKDKSEIKSLITIMDTVLPLLHKSSLAYKLAKRLADDLVI